MESSFPLKKKKKEALWDSDYNGGKAFIHHFTVTLYGMALISPLHLNVVDSGCRHHLYLGNPILMEMNISVTLT